MSKEKIGFEVKWTIRYLLASPGFLLLTSVEGMMMRYQHISRKPWIWTTITP